MIIKIRSLHFNRKVWVGALAVGVAFAFTVNPLDFTTPFELDGNATQISAADDWQNVNANGGTSLAHTGVAYDPSSFSGGTTTTDPSTFVQGSKDTDDVSSWKTAPGGIPPKDDIVNAYAAAYNVNGDLVITFGADRFANNGSAQLGFWFFQGNIAPPASGTGAFTGSHVVGDILVLANFNQGGGVPSIQVLKWIGGKNPLQPLNANAGQCGDPAATQICAITNANPVSLYWPSVFKSPAPAGSCTDTGAVSCAPPVSFFEGAINVSQLLGGNQNVPCISSFMTETRSSTSVTASLEDWVIHSFNVCGLSIAKTCRTGAINAAGDGFTYTYSGSVTNSGFGVLSNVVVTDTFPTSPNSIGTAIYNIGTVAAGTTAYFPGPLSTDTATFNSSVNGPINSATVTAGTLTKSTTAQCTAPQVSPSLSVTKTCGVCLVQQTRPNGPISGAKVNFNGKICNTGNDQLTNVQITDDPAAATAITLGATTLARPANPTNPDATTGACTTYSGSYVPGTAPSGNPLGFTDQVTVTATSALGGTVTPAMQPATCNICPAGLCP